MVDNLQESMKQMIELREFYAERFRDLERQLKDAAPDSLNKSMQIRTIQLADIMIELEDGRGKVDALEEKCRKLQEDNDDQEDKHQDQILLFQKKLEIVEFRSKAKHARLLADLQEANEESANLQEMYRSMRRNYASVTKNIAIMASKISKLQQENSNLRVEADSSHQALVGLEIQQLGLSSEDSSTRAGQSLQSQLVVAQFETEKLVAERIASQSIIAELQSQVRMLQGALVYQTRVNARVAQIRPDSSTSSLDRESESSRELNESNSHDALDRLDRMLTIGGSMTERTDGDSSSDSSSLTDATPKQANTSTELDEPVQILRQSPDSPEKPAPAQEPEKVRRMPIEINGLEGNYTGPLNTTGLPHGTGTIRFKNGDTYLGDMDNGRLHGKGAIYFANKRKPTFRGNFVSNRPVT
jgi:hypothetical protein